MTAVAAADLLVRAQLSDKRWQVAKEKAREASRGHRRGGSDDEDDTEEEPAAPTGRKPSPSGYSIYSSIAEATPAGQRQLRNWEQIGVGRPGSPGRPVPDVDNYVFTPATVGGGSGGSRWPPYGTPGDVAASATRSELREHSSASMIRHDTAEEDDLPGSASRRLDELRSRCATEGGGLSPLIIASYTGTSDYALRFRGLMSLNPRAIVSYSQMLIVNLQLEFDRPRITATSRGAPAQGAAFPLRSVSLNRHIFNIIA